jgi:KipI family sensor histidine kinase inhibitor
VTQRAGSIRSYGSTALLVETDSAVTAVALRARLDAQPPRGVIETMPGLHTVLVRFDPAVTDADRLAAAVSSIEIDPDDLGAAAAEVQDEVSVRVDYSGADLADVAEHSGLTVEQVIDAHQARSYRVLFIGMAPGFYFLAGGDPRLNPPRRSSPRTSVPKGAVGLAGELTGIYPRSGPGGWQLIGTVVDDLWDPTRLPAALLAPGTSVRFTSTG